MLYLCRVKPLRHYLRGFLIAAWAGDKIAEFSFPEISFHFPLRPWFFFVSPAYAGKRRTIPRRRSAAPDHPRVCGEKLNGNAKGQAATGSPPRMRGKEVRGQDVADARRITPAYAGKRDYRMKPNRVSGDHPRVCGEKYASILVFSGCSGITPAYAGKSLIHISS